MNIKTEKDKKRVYNEPLIEVIQIDNLISLALESEEPPVLPNEGKLIGPQYYNNDPLKFK